MKTSVARSCIALVISLGVACLQGCTNRTGQDKHHASEALSHRYPVEFVFDFPDSCPQQSLGMVVISNLTAFDAGGKPAAQSREGSCSTNVLVRHGDLLTVHFAMVCEAEEEGNEKDMEAAFAFQYFRTDGDPVRVQIDKAGRSTVSGKSWVMCNPDHFARDIEALPSKDAKSLRTLLFLSDEMENWRRTAAKLSDCSPDAFLITDVTGDELKELLGTVKCRKLYVPEITSETLRILTGSDTEVLVCNELSTSDLTALGQLPRLREFLVGEVTIESDGPPTIRLPENNLPLTGLALGQTAEHKSFAVENLCSIRQLRELIIPGDVLPDVDVNKAFPELQSLYTQVSSLKVLPSNLRTLGFANDEGITPDLLASVVSRNPDLVHIELIASTELGDLNALKRLPRLRHVICDADSDAEAAVKTLTTLDQLTYLGLQADVLEKEEVAAALRENLPNCRIAAYDGFCMGSGRILLLFPFVIFAGILFRAFRCYTGTAVNA
ncbi:MAG: hypothetical protein K9N51_03130 [Candidatus Pacebacteria bacterium]|nr:hypothetical protein [Candidatus Paceibacterota bacterium]